MEQRETIGAAPKISILMPSKNVRPYIEECMESVLHQTLRDIEIFCVDADSTDGTLACLERYAAADRRVHILHDDRGSTGYANNLAIRQATGKYIGLVETDDYVEPEMFERLYEAAETAQADVCRMDFARFWGDGAERETLVKQIAARGQYGRTLTPRTEQAIFANDPFIWTGIYRRAFLLENDIWYHETPGAAYQDTGFWFQTFAFADKLLYLPGVGYHYRLDNPASSVHNPTKAFALCDELAFVREQLEKRNLFQTYAVTFYTILFNRYLWSYQRAADELRLPFVRRFREDLLPAMGMDLPLTRHQKALLDELMDSPERFHASREAERSRLQELLAGGRPIVLMGCGSDGMRMLDELRAHHQLDRLVCLADNDEKLQGQQHFGKEILSPHEAHRRYPEAAYLVTSLNYGDEIKAQLLAMGIKPEKIWTGHIC